MSEKVFEVKGVTKTCFMYMGMLLEPNTLFNFSLTEKEIDLLKEHINFIENSKKDNVEVSKKEIKIVDENVKEENVTISSEQEKVFIEPTMPIEREIVPKVIQTRKPIPKNATKRKK